jgi:acyl carrier protein
MTDSATEAAIREFLLTEVFYDKNLGDLASDENLIERGLLDSLGILKTVTFCEEQFGITIPDQEVLPDHMESVSAIAALVERRRRAAP